MVTFAKALSEWATLLSGVSEPQALEEHEEAGPWGALTGRSGTRVPTRASLGLGPGRRGCQGPILGAVRTHYPHLCAGTMASPVPPCHPEVDETVLPAALVSWPTPLGRLQQDRPGTQIKSAAGRRWGWPLRDQTP